MKIGISKPIVGIVGTVLVIILGYILIVKPQEFDFGDAPDAKLTGYTGGAGALTGSFPTSLASNGTRTQKTDEVWLGQTVDRESDAKQVNGDSYDDGVRLELTPDKTSYAHFFVQIKSPGQTTGTAYLNLFVDWNKDGKWTSQKDVSADEWAVQNYTVDLGKQTAQIAVYAPEFTAGKDVTSLWYRAMITKDEKATAEGGAGKYANGEVEDYGPYTPDGKEYGAYCDPDPLEINHGEEGEITVLAEPWSQPFTEVLFPNSFVPNIKDIRNISINGNVITYESLNVDPPKRIEVVPIDIRVRFGKEASILETCWVEVTHEDTEPMFQAWYTEEDVSDYTVLTVFAKPVNQAATDLKNNGVEISLKDLPELAHQNYFVNEGEWGGSNWKCSTVKDGTALRCRGKETMKLNKKSGLGLYFLKEVFKKIDKLPPYLKGFILNAAGKAFPFVANYQQQ